MNASTLKHLAGRRNALIARSAAQRDALSKQSQAMAYTMSTLDHGLGFLQRIKNSPAAIAGLLAGIALIKPRRLLPLLRTGLIAWQTLHTVAPLLHDQVMRMRNKEKPDTGKGGF